LLDLGVAWQLPINPFFTYLLLDFDGLSRTYSGWQVAQELSDLQVGYEITLGFIRHTSIALVCSAKTRSKII